MPESGSLDDVRFPSDKGHDFEKLATYLFLSQPEAHSASAKDVDKKPTFAGPSKEAENSSHSSSNLAQPPSRTSSQIRALRYFKKELERYADMTSAAGKVANFTPTISPAAFSLHTVEELLPYREQFLAAGLAVTSADQGPAKGKGARPKPAQAQLDGEGRTRYSSPSSTSTTMIHFRERDSLDMALIDELPVRKTKEKRRRTQTRSILPWFRRKSTAAPGIPPSAQKGQPQEVVVGQDQAVLDQAQAPQPPQKSSMRHPKKQDGEL